MLYAIIHTVFILSEYDFWLGGIILICKIGKIKIFARNICWDEETGLPKPINGLGTATYGLPDLEIPHPTLGLSVNLSWGEGLWFNEVEL